MKYEAIGAISGSSPTWFKKDGKFGYLDVANNKVLIEAEYGYPLYFSRNGYAEAWKSRKAGVINLKNEVVIPIVYDEIRPRRQYGENGVSVFRGYACFRNGGATDFYNELLLPDQRQEWDDDGNTGPIDPENKDLSVEQLEDKIRDNFRKLMEMGFHYPEMQSCFGEEHRKEVRKLEETVKDAIWDRRKKMNSSWVHSSENADRISRMNDLLMKAVRKAISLGNKTAKSLRWMEKVSNRDDYEVSVCVYPFWQDDRSRTGYVPAKKSRAGERDRLTEQEDNESLLHIWNIIARMGEIPIHDGITCCFSNSSYKYNPDDWNYRKCVMDDGQSWDELIHYPVYQDVYFLAPFHHLYCDLYDYSFEDLASINDFRVEVKVTLRTKEQKSGRIPADSRR